MVLKYITAAARGPWPKYPEELQRHATELAATPADWMPWNYRDTLALLSAS